MKFLVFAVCVCAASAATVVSTDTLKTVETAVEPVVETVVPPVVQPVEGVARSFVYTNSEAEAPILRMESKIEPNGFNYIYETGNGINAQATGVVKRVLDEDVLVVQGAYQYRAPDGTPVDFTYIADENGYQPKSDLIPVSPPIPELILRALQYVLAHPSKETGKKL